MIAASGTCIGRLRLGAREPARARLGAETVLRAGDLAPGGLPRAALLFVRSLRDPRPRTLCLDGRSVRPPPEWEGAVRDSLESELRGAARPAHDAVPAGATAVVFADRAELLACLARDWCDGSAGARWWWRTLVGGDLRAAVRVAWSETPEAVPAAIDLLAHWGRAAAFVRALDDADVAALVAALRPRLERALPSSIRSGAAAAGEPEPEPAPAKLRARAGPEPPWRPFVAASELAGLDPLRELLVGLSVVWSRAPALGSRPAFAAAVRAWTAARGGEEVRPGRRFVDAGVAAERGPSAPPAQVPEASPSPPGRPRSVGGGTKRRERARAAPGPEPRPSETHPTREPSPHAAPSRSRRTPARAVLREHAPSASRPAPEAPPLALPSETALGGLFHLVGVGVFVGLYGDFTTPSEPGIPLDPWDFVTLIGRRLLRDPRPDDPVWRVLADLAGRDPGAEPGRGYRPPRDWRIPPHWLEPFETHEPWRWSAAGGRLRIRHPGGFVAVDVERRGALETQLARALRRYGAPSAVSGRAAARHAGGARQRWAAWVGDYVAVRLRLAVGARSNAAAVRMVLERPARVLVSAGRVDVTFSLDELPIAVRQAGLDRDPGWIPAAGRSLHFHFD